MEPVFPARRIPGGSVTIGNVWVSGGAHANACGELWWGNIEKEATPTASATPTPHVTLTPRGTLTQLWKRTPVFPPTATMTQDGANATITLRAHYSAVASNAGEVRLTIHAEVVPDQGRFATVTASYRQTLTSAITWAT